MTPTEWRADFTKVVKGRATAYTGNARSGYKMDMPFTNVIGSGGLLTTVGDRLPWNAFLDNPSALPGGALLVQSMTTQMVLNNGRRIPYALGVSLTSREGMREISHSGSTAGYRTWLARYPDEHASTAVLCNAGDAASPAALAQTALLGTLGRTPSVATMPPRVHVPPETMRKYDATFVGPTPEHVARFSMRDTVLMQLLPVDRALTPIGNSRFRAGAIELVFEGVLAMWIGYFRSQAVFAEQSKEFIPGLRLQAQGISTPSATATPADIVTQLGAVQAQDYYGALWSIALRTTAATRSDAEAAIANRTIIRSWPMRGILHFIPAVDARWMLELMTPRIMKGAAGRYRQLGARRRRIYA